MYSWFYIRRSINWLTGYVSSEVDIVREPEVVLLDAGQHDEGRGADGLWSIEGVLVLIVVSLQHHTTHTQLKKRMYAIDTFQETDILADIDRDI